MRLILVPEVTEAKSSLENLAIGAPDFHIIVGVKLSKVTLPQPIPTSVIRSP